MQAMREIDWNLLLVYGVKAGISSLPSWLEKREAQPIGNVEGVELAWCFADLRGWA